MDEKYPQIPDKKYFTIGEVSEICDLKSHVLRYWEQVFSQLKPTKRRGRRYYQKEDLILLFEIKDLVHEQGFTIAGAQARLAQTNSAQEILDSDEPVSDNQLVEKIRQMHSDCIAFQEYISQKY